MLGLVVLAVDRQSVMDRNAGEGGQDPGGVHRDPTALGVQVEQRPRLGAGDVNPVQSAGDPAAGLIEVQGRRRGELLPSDREEPA